MNSLPNNVVAIGPAGLLEHPRLMHPKKETAFGCPRNFLGNRFVYAVISPRAKGLSIGVNMNPDKNCDFDCAYCEVSRNGTRTPEIMDVEIMAEELQKLLALESSGQICEHPFFSTVPHELLKLRQVTLSGDGEPTLAKNFSDAVQAVMHVRARSRMSFFKVVLITNGSRLDSEDVQHGLKYFTREDEVWAKLDAGTQAYMDKVNRAKVPLQAILNNILSLARRRPVVIQSLFPAIHGQEPPVEEILEYAQRLKELVDSGAQISLVQIYSATRPTTHSECGHLPLRSLSRIAQTVRSTTGLKAEVF